MKLSSGQRNFITPEATPDMENRSIDVAFQRQNAMLTLLEQPLLEVDVVEHQERKGEEKSKR